MSDSRSVDIGDDETLARFVMYHRWLRVDGTVKPDAFTPPPDLNLSTTRLAGLPTNEVWRIGRDVARVSDRELLGRADLVVLDVVLVGLAAQAAPVPGNPNHAHIVGWPQDKATQKNLRQELAAKSQFVTAAGADR